MPSSILLIPIWFLCSYLVPSNTYFYCASLSPATASALAEIVGFHQLCMNCFFQCWFVASVHEIWGSEWGKGSDVPNTLDEVSYWKQISFICAVACCRYRLFW
ncbi:hypothetical protein QQ045_023003 [Rhodiola kirilowii]